jgi:hypothetical protein
MSAFRKLDIADFLAKQAPQNFSNFSSPEVAPPQSGTDGESEVVKAAADTTEFEKHVAQIAELERADALAEDFEERAAIIEEGTMREQFPSLPDNMIGQWAPVPPAAILHKQFNPTGSAIACLFDLSGTLNVTCFIRETES